jgi:hypothetical protein
MELQRLTHEIYKSDPQWHDKTIGEAVQDFSISGYDRDYVKTIHSTANSICSPVMLMPHGTKFLDIDESNKQSNVSLLQRSNYHRCLQQMVIISYLC